MWHRIGMGLRHPELALEYLLLGSEKFRLLNNLAERVHALQILENPSIDVVDRFHVLYFNEIRGRTWSDTHWFGVPLQKNPMDLWVYQETIFEVKPDVIVECGTFQGGSALFFASLFDLMRNGEVITIDLEAQAQRPSHKRIKYLTGSSTSGDILSKVKEMVKGNGKVFVVLDSDHSKHHVLDEMNQYSKLVTKGSYMVVEDTNLNGHPVVPGWGPGPMEAVNEFLATNLDFVRDETREKFLMTFFPGGWLKRIRS